MKIITIPLFLLLVLGLITIRELVAPSAERLVNEVKYFIILGCKISTKKTLGSQSGSGNKRCLQRHQLQI